MTNTTAAKHVEQAQEKSQPWWRYPMVWLMIGGPLTVVIAGITTVVIAYQHIDPVLDTRSPSVRPENLPAVHGRNLAADTAMRAPSQTAGQ